MEEQLKVWVKVTFNDSCDNAYAVGRISDVDVDNQKMVLSNVILLTRLDSLLKLPELEIHGSKVSEMESLTPEQVQDVKSKCEKVIAAQTAPTIPKKIDEEKVETTYIDLKDIKKAVPNSFGLDPAILAVTSTPTTAPARPHSSAKKNQKPSYSLHSSSEEDSVSSGSDNLLVPDVNLQNSQQNSIFKKNSKTEKQKGKGNSLVQNKSSSGALKIYPSGNTPRDLSSNKANALFSKNQKKADSWANQDVSKFNDLEFDFEANLKLFDKKKVFDEIRSKDDSDPAILLVNTNKIEKPSGGVNLSSLSSLLNTKNISAPLNDPSIIASSKLSSTINTNNNSSKNGSFVQSSASGVSVEPVPIRSSDFVDANHLTVSQHQWSKIEHLLATRMGIDESLLSEISGKVGSQVALSILNQRKKFLGSDITSQYTFRVLVIPGPGRNGLYGLCCSRFLANLNNVDVFVYNHFENSSSFLVNQKLLQLKVLGVKMFNSFSHLKKRRFDLIIDSLFTPNDPSHISHIASRNKHDLIKHIIQDLNPTPSSSPSSNYDVGSLGQIVTWYRKQNRASKLALDFPTLDFLEISSKSTSSGQTLEKLEFNNLYSAQDHTHPLDNKNGASNNTNEDGSKRHGRESGISELDFELQSDGYTSDVEGLSGTSLFANKTLLCFGMPSSTFSTKIDGHRISDLVGLVEYSSLLADIGIPFSFWQENTTDGTSFDSVGPGSSHPKKSPFSLSEIVA
ncbi:hypothetical protein BB560_004391 [Smittium megazygosporum]|uniref:Enhancer of mRNA-decapping protein 3 n=1 Tax=Smittium megazygosporum TaxID=133381 RepID=A0A2T9Z9G8_9FUNG|nr:hypothetical protein BB560_004391 [Smittium megazygosporum]